MRFTDPRDYDTVLRINREFLNDVVDTPVIVYKPNAAKSKTNSYGEAPKKTWMVGVRISCLLKIDKQKSVENVQTVDVTQTLEAAFLREELRLTNLMPEIGDIIEFDSQYYEINTAADSQFWAGRVAYDHAIVCSAHLMRKSNLQLERPKL